MSISTMMNIGTSGLLTAQTGLRVTSDNIANVNTPGYVRKVVDQQSLATGGYGAGVDVAGVRLAVDRFLQAAGLNATSEAARAGATAELFDRVQAYFGDPSGDVGLFSKLDQLFGAFSAAADDPASAPARQQAVTSTAAFFQEAQRISEGLLDVRLEADGRIATAVDRANQLLEQIEQLNVDISRQTLSGRDASGAQGVQAQLIDELAKVMDVKIQPRAQGGVNLRTASGMLLAGDGAARLSHVRAAAGAGFEEIYITPARGEARPLLDHITSGEIKGLVELRDEELPAVAARLTEFVASTAQAINAAHNASSAVPAPSSLTGRNIGLDLPTAVSGFTGRTTVAITGPGNVLQRRVDIDFTAGTMSVDGGGAVGFAPASFLATLNGALAPLGGASFAGGALSLTASGGRGVAFTDDPAAPTAKAGKSFGSFFGLNDLIRSSGISDFDTGLRSADPHGFTPGDTITLRMTSASGARLRDVTVAVPAGGTMNDLIGALNASPGGVGLYGVFALDANGRMAFQPTTTPAIGLVVVEDRTARGGPGGPSMSALFGFDPQTAARRSESFAVRSDIYADSSRMSLARLDLAAPAGKPVLALGDNRGGIALAEAGSTLVRSGGQTLSLSRSASEFSGSIGAKARAAQDRKDASEAVAGEALNQRQAHEGVNLDEELVKLTTYQQSFNASSRLIQAAKDVYDILLAMV